MTWLVSIGIAIGIVFGILAFIYLLMKFCHAIDIEWVYIFFLVVLVLILATHTELF